MEWLTDSLHAKHTNPESAMRALNTKALLLEKRFSGSPPKVKRKDGLTVYLSEFFKTAEQQTDRQADGAKWKEAL